MTLLDRYYSKRLALTLCKALASLIFVFILVDLLTHRRAQMMRHDVPLNIAALYYVMYIPRIIYTYQIGALSMLVASLLVLGEAAQNSEVTAALAGGISLRRLVRGPVLVAALFAVTLFLLQEFFGAAAGVKALDLHKRYFASTLQASRPGVSWARLDGDWTCHVMKFNKLALTGEDVFLHCNRPDSVQQILAKRIYWDEAARQWMLEDGRWLMLDPKNDWQGPVYRITLQAAPIKETPEDLFALDNEPENKRFGQLAKDIKRAAARGIPVAGPLSELYAKVAQPALSFVVIWLAIPFALRVRRGGLAIGFGISTAIALAYLVMFWMSMSLGAADRLPPLLAAWLANVVFLALGLTMFHRTQT